MKFDIEGLTETHWYIPVLVKIVQINGYFSKDQNASLQESRDLLAKYRVIRNDCRGFNNLIL